ncbi:TPA: portal protein [Aquificae Conch Spring virus]|nr:TPA: portal protein [Aquificae Conch Spring virus]
MILSINNKLYNLSDVEPYVLSKINAIESAYARRLISLIRYMQELNGETNIPDPPYPWQSKFKSSMFYQKVFFAYFYLRSFLEKAFENLFTVDTDNEHLQVLLTKILQHYIKVLNVKDALSKILYYSLLSGYGFLYITYNEDLKRIDLQVVNPLHSKITPDLNYICLTEYLPIPEAIRRYNLTYDQIKPYIVPQEDPEHTVFTYLQKLYNDRLVRIDKFYGIIFLPDDIITPHLYIVLNKQKLITAEIMPDKITPFVVEFLYGINTQVSFADLVYPYYVQDTILTRAILDSALVNLTLGFEIDTTLVDEDSLADELRPWKIFYTRGGGDVQAIRPIKLANFDPNALPIRNLIQNEATNISAITEFIMGLPSSRSRITAREVALKTHQTQMTLAIFIERLETVFISQLLTKLLYYILKYEAPNLQQILTTEEILFLSTVTPDDILSQVKFKIRGFTSVVQKSERLEKIMTLLELFGQLGLLPILNIEKLIHEILYNLDLPPDIIQVNKLAQLIQAYQTTQLQQEQQEQIVELLKLIPKLIKHPSMENVDIPQLLTQLTGIQIPQKPYEED